MQINQGLKAFSHLRSSRHDNRVKPHPGPVAAMRRLPDHLDITGPAVADRLVQAAIEARPHSFRSSGAGRARNASAVPT